jgi:integrase
MRVEEGLVVRERLFDARSIDASVEAQHKEQSLRAIVSFLLGTGARRGEALALRWSDVDLKKNVVRIERSLEQTKGSLRIKSPKTKRGRRNVTISPWLAAELRAHGARQDERRLSLGMGRAPDETPLCLPNGTESSDRRAG